MINGLCIDIVSLSGGRKRTLSMCTLIFSLSSKNDTLHPGQKGAALHAHVLHRSLP